MRQQGSGVIVHVTARPGIEPAGGMAAYRTSKAALVHLTRILDIELRPHGIRVNAVAPQLLDTPANRATFPAEVMAHAVAPEAIAGVIAFLSATPQRQSAERYCRRTALNEADTARRTTAFGHFGYPASTRAPSPGRLRPACLAGRDSPVNRSARMPWPSGGGTVPATS